jgi:hypothetical protein
MSRSNYALSKSFGCSMPDPSNNPLSYCVLGANVDNMFLHGGHVKSQNFPFGMNCQAFMSDYCAQGWDDFCEISCASDVTSWPNSIDSKSPQGLTQGEMLIRNTVAKKYLSETDGSCKMSVVQFDPLVVNSPKIRFFCNSAECRPKYEVDPETINQDIVMNKLLNNPYIGKDLLLNIYETMSSKGTLTTLQGTNIGNYFMSKQFMDDLSRYQNRPWRP